LSEEVKALKSRLDPTLAAGGIVFRERFFSPGRVELTGGIEAVRGLCPGVLKAGWEGWTRLVHPEDLVRFNELMDRSLAAGGSYEIEYRMRGEHVPVWVREHGVVYHDSQRAPAAVSSLIREISEIQDLESRLGHARKMEAFGKLAGGVAHDFNNMLAVILGYSQLVLNDFAKDDPRLSFVQEIESAARRASSLTSQLLAFTRQEVQGTLVLQMDDVLNEMGKMLVRLIGEQITLVLNPGAGEAGKVQADRNQIEQLLIHLSVCARDLLPNGGFFTLHTRLAAAEAGDSPECAPGGRFLLAAECRSLSPTDVKKTSPGATVPWTDELAALGTCESIAEASGGRMQPGGCEALPDALAIFFPLVVPPAPAAVSGGGAGSPIILGRPVEGGAVLLVEDDKGLRNLGRVVLTRMGYRVIEAENGVEGLRAFDLAPPGEIVLVITDIVMPAMGGREMAERIYARAPSLPVLFLSGYPEQFQLILQGKPPTTHSFLRKPFPMGDLTEKVRELLG
jgi:two-component system cell cycle sensor histidine kinase/response regulator CckA